MEADMDTTTANVTSSHAEDDAATVDDVTQDESEAEYVQRVKRLIEDARRTQLEIARELGRADVALSRAREVLEYRRYSPRSRRSSA